MLAAVMVFSLAACGSSSSSSDSADSSADTSDEDTADSDVNDGTGSVLRVAMECAYAPYNWSQ